MPPSSPDDPRPVTADGRAHEADDGHTDAHIDTARAVPEAGAIAGGGGLAPGPPWCSGTASGVIDVVSLGAVP